MTKFTSFLKLFNNNLQKQFNVEREVEFEELTLEKGQAIQLDGKTVVAYLRTRKEEDIDSDRLPAIHLTYCMHLKKQPEKFFCTSFDASHERKFYVETVDKQRNIVRNKSKEYSLNVCPFCIEELYGIPFNDRTYLTTGITNKGRIFELSKNFDINSFIESDYLLNPRIWYSSTPEESSEGKWKSISREVRERSNWVCDECEVSFAAPHLQKYLHVHHINQNSTQNHTINLRPLCIECHAEQPNHSHMKQNNVFYQTYMALKSI